MIFVNISAYFLRFSLFTNSLSLGSAQGLSQHSLTATCEHKYSSAKRKKSSRFPFADFPFFFFPISTFLSYFSLLFFSFHFHLRSMLPGCSVTFELKTILLLLLFSSVFFLKYWRGSELRITGEYRNHVSFGRQNFKICQALGMRWKADPNQSASQSPSEFSLLLSQQGYELQFAIGLVIETFIFSCPIKLLPVSSSSCEFR